jgi:hypothetical protein
MARKMAFGGLAMSSDVWLSLMHLMFPKDGHNWEALHKGDPFGPAGPVFYCETCDESFQMDITPTRCPHCRAGPGEQAITLTHKSHTDKTFPFYLPL